jgi:RNA polymerase sigma-70 factor (family 1)
LPTDHVYNEPELLKRLSNGDEAAFRILMRLYFVVIVQFARKMLLHDAAAEDMASETFIALWENRRKVDSLKMVKAFLFITCKNKCLNEIRSRRREDDRHLEYIARMEDNRLITAEIIRAEVVAQILAAGNGLPPKIRRVFEMGILEGMSNQEIATQLQVSVNTVKTQKARALELLKHQFAENTLLIAILIYLS